MKFFLFALQNIFAEKAGRRFIEIKAGFVFAPPSADKFAKKVTQIKQTQK